MSLINDALKKAQRLRTDEPEDLLGAVPMGAGPRVAKRNAPRTAQQIVLLAAGGVVLVVLSVVGTFWLVNRAPAPKTPAPSVTSSSPKTTLDSPKTAAIVLPPVITKVPVPSGDVAKLTAVAPAALPPTNSAPPAAIVPAAPAPAPAASTITRAATPTPETPRPGAPVKPIPTSVAESRPASSAPLVAPLPGDTAVSVQAPAPAAVATPAGPPKTDERIHAFVDSIRVTAIRAAGEDSRVQMNGSFYRLKDIVDRTLGLRLTSVESNSLTFTDSNGAVYVKNF